ncbi:hypothetical protein [Streptomyces sp. NPDC047079]|uniref:hypothetical protein n=1 Tax=Streptomyces sp. NPDC047079 TaxID=3154607 RepID=UPI0034100B9C
MNEPAQRQQIGYDMAGNPMFAAPPVQYAQPSVVQSTMQPLQPIKAHPWGAYIAGGCVGVLALVVVVVAIAFLVFGFAILAAVLALAVVSLTICVLVLRGLWADFRKGN